MKGASEQQQQKSNCRMEHWLCALLKGWKRGVLRIVPLFLHRCIFGVRVKTQWCVDRISWLSLWSQKKKKEKKRIIVCSGRMEDSSCIAFLHV